MSTRPYQVSVYSMQIVVFSLVACVASVEAATLSPGTFWEFRWDEEVSSTSSSGSSTSRDAGLFRVTLGAATSIQGKTAYGVSTAGRPPDGAFTWQYLVPDGLGFLGSEDGSTLVTLFDPTRSSWTGNGFFEDFAGFNRVGPVTWGIGVIDNDYVVADAAKTHASANKDRCETIGGVVICGDESYHHDWYEYYTDDVGPVGSKHQWSATFSGGGFFSAHNGSSDVGLIATSLLGDRILFGLETEPNPLASPMPLPPLPETIGFAAQSDDSDPITLSLPGGDATIDVHDWYSFSLFSAGNVSFTLSWDSLSGTSDLDLILYQRRPFPLGNIVVSYSIDDNIMSGVESEFMQLFLTTIPFSSYLVGISAFDTGGQAVEYTLSVVPEPSESLLRLTALGALCFYTALRARRRPSWRFSAMQA